MKCSVMKCYEVDTSLYLDADLLLLLLFFVKSTIKMHNGVNSLQVSFFQWIL